MMLACPNRNHKDWIDLENAVGETEAYRDYIENKGEVRHYNTVFEKLLQRNIAPSAASDKLVGKLIKATEKMEIAAKADVVRRLRSAKTLITEGNRSRMENVMSQRSWIETDDGKNTLITVPKTLNEKDFARAGQIGEIPVNRTKDVIKWRDLGIYLTQQESKGVDVSFIDTIETNDAYLVRIPTDVYKTALGKERTVQSFIAYYKGDDPTIHDTTNDSLIGNAIGEAGIPGVDEISTGNSQSVGILKGFALGLANRLQIDGKPMNFSFVTEAEAVQILGQEEWNKASLNNTLSLKGFLHGDTVYFVGDNLSLDAVFHEFGHPVVRTIALNTPEVFEGLYNDLSNTQEGQELITKIKALYPELEGDLDRFKEEVLVHAITKAAELEKTGLAPSSPFAKIIQNIMYAIRKMLRSFFKTDFSKLSPNTTIKDIAEMMKTAQNFQINEGALNQADVVAYVKEMESHINDILKVAEGDRNALTVRQYDIAVKHIDTVLKNKNYKHMADILLDEYDRGDLQEIKRNLSKFSRPIEDKLKNMKDQILYNKAHAEAMVNSLFRLQNITKKIHAHLKTMKEDKEESFDNMHKAFYYDYLLNYWKQFADESLEAFRDAGLPSDSAAVNLVNSINTEIANSKDISRSFYSEGVKDVLMDTLNPMAERINQKYSNIITNLKTKGAPQKLMDKWFEEFYGLTEEELERKSFLQKKKASQGLGMDEKKELTSLVRKSFNGAQITPEKIEAALKGEMGDANVFSSFFEGYMYNSDVVVGGFAAYVKNHMADVSSITQKKFNDYVDNLSPLLEAAGYNPANTTDLIKKIARIEKIGKFNDKGEWEEKEIWTLMSAHKDWRIALDRLTKDKNEAEKQYVTTGTSEDHEAYIQAVAAKKKHLREFFHQEYQQQVYAREGLLERDAVGIKAAQMMDDIFQKMNAITAPLTNQTEELESLDALDALWKEYYRMFSLVDEKGKLKDPMSVEYAVAVRLREYRDAGKDPQTGKSYYEWILRKGLFENALEQYEQELVNQKILPGTDDFNQKRKDWIERNTRVAVKDSFYEERKKIIDAIKAITSKMSTAGKRASAVADGWERIIDMTSDKRDEDGQPDGGLYSEEALGELHRLQVEMQNELDQLEGSNGLTKQENARYQGYMLLFKQRTRLTQDEQEDFDMLSNKQQNYGLAPSERARLFNLFKALKEMQSKSATPYYIDIANAWMKEMNPDTVEMFFPEGEINEKNVDRLLDFSVQMRMFKENKDFEKWFKMNHIKKTFFNYEIGQMDSAWERTYAWSAIKPSEAEEGEEKNLKYFDSYTIKHAGKEDEIIRGRMPKLKFYIRRVKNEYRTKHVVGETIDNQGNFLPRLDVANNPYIDQDYLNMKNTDKAHYDILEKMKEHHLRNQESASRKSRLYLDLPRFRKNNLELVQTKSVKDIAGNKTEEKFPLFYNLFQRIRDFFRKAKDQQGTKHNWDDEAMLMRLDMYDNEIASIPIHGLYDLNINDVSTDVNQSLMRYMFSLEKQKKLIEINPVAQALKATVNDPANMSKQLDRINKFNFLHRGMVTYLNKKGMYVRKWAVNNFIEREFEGKTNAGFTKDVPVLQNFGDLMFKRASFAFFALNIPSALKNTMGAKFQSMVEASGGQYTDHKSMARGEAWSGVTMGQISANVYNRDLKPLNIQLADAFDAIRGRAETKLPESLSRTFWHDIADFGWLYNFRRWTQGQAELQLFSSMMFKQQIPQNGKMIDYMDAWELRENRLSLKEGIDARYSNNPIQITVVEGDTSETLAKKFNIPEVEAAAVFGKVKVGREINLDNSKFKEFRNKLHTVQMNLNGAYDKFDQPEAQRYLAFRFVVFMKKYFTPMLMNRWQFSGSIGRARGRFNPGLGDMQEGYYITAIKTLHRIFTTGENYFPYMTDIEKAAFKKFVIEVGAAMVLLLVVAPLLGWDPEDPERYSKLRKRSGSLPIPGLTEEDPNNPFDLGGFTMNHLLKLTLDVRAENEAFLPFPNYGLDDYTRTATEAGSISFGPTIKTYKKMLEYLYMEVTGNKYARYSKDAGPYTWQKEGGSKFATEFAKSIGLTGSSLDPVTNVKNTYGTRR